MPDWVYRTVARRALFSIPDEAGRAVALGVIGTLGRNAAGRAVIEFMGHMKPDRRLEVRIDGMEFPSPIGLGWRVDPEQRAARGLSHFGVGCIEQWIGPRRRVRRDGDEALCDGASMDDSGGGEAPRDPVLLLRRRIDPIAGEVVQLPNGTELRVRACDDRPRADEYNDLHGVVLQVGTRLSTGGWRVPSRMPDGLPDLVREWRKALPAEAPLILAGGVACPSEARTLVEAGASLVLLDAGMVFRGPGLAKRCNEALVSCGSAVEEAGRNVSLFRRAWFWAGALGAALAAGGGATLVLAATRVLLPYDEHYLGVSAESLQRGAPLLFAFMAHDRGTLAGTMLGLGALYIILGAHGIRRGKHGAKTAVIASALTGFASFFAFFGFGYFDTLHAFVAAVLFQLTVQIMVSEEGGASPSRGGADIEDAAWRRAQWGQLLWVVHAIGLLGAGAVILAIGMTSVFVSEDLNFLCLSVQQAQALDGRMIAVVAHDRATLGGMLLAAGIAMLLPVLWCFGRGEKWLWWAVAGLGAPAYAAALGVHFWVGYTDSRHLVPAFVGLALWLGGLLFSRSYLATKRSESRKFLQENTTFTNTGYH